LLAALIGGCVSYEHEQIAPDGYEIKYGDDYYGGSVGQTRSECALLLSAQLTRTAGYRYFLATEGSSTFHSYPSTSTTKWVSTGGGGLAPVTTWSGGGGGTVTYQYRIKLLEERPSFGEQLGLARRYGLRYDAIFVYDADQLERALLQGADLDCPFDPPSPD
jgi:hypothetical protein